ncbi:MAG: 3-methyl-2-oxobutanoate hydroxymethyltransferase [Actinomycetes bacterium]
MATPILLNSCARAATAAEARFRITGAIPPSRTRVVALDAEAEAVVRRTAELPWSNARFFVADTRGTAVPRQPDEGALNDVVLRSLDGDTSRLSEELESTDVAVMVAAGNDGAATASAIGGACFLRGIMTAGLVLADSNAATEAVSALRPYARVLLVTRDESDMTELLTALRA